MTQIVISDLIFISRLSVGVHGPLPPYTRCFSGIGVKLARVYLVQLRNRGLRG